ncbi:hypothetical protein CRG98_018911 [Punica granatum]|uniref:Uncharacterized protein n=1 Tax=Punica granatum TaxID=22663 RepID=A0A2I0JWG1_PUNGR|nr:hypothetical protein CRG98_018911 [Punica granatum]
MTQSLESMAVDFRAAVATGCSTTSTPTSSRGPGFARSSSRGDPTRDGLKEADSEATMDGDEFDASDYECIIQFGSFVVNSDCTTLCLLMTFQAKREAEASEVIELPGCDKSGLSFGKPTQKMMRHLRPALYQGKHGRGSS